MHEGTRLVLVVLQDLAAILLIALAVCCGHVGVELLYDGRRRDGLLSLAVALLLAALGFWVM